VIVRPEDVDSRCRVVDVMAPGEDGNVDGTWTARRVLAAPPRMTFDAHLR